MFARCLKAGRAQSWLDSTWQAPKSRKEGRVMPGEPDRDEGRGGFGILMKNRMRWGLLM